MPGALITGFTGLSAATAFRIYLSEQFPTALRGRGHSSASRSFLMAPYTGSSTIVFATILVVVSIGASIPLLFGARRWSSAKPFTETVPELA